MEFDYNLTRKNKIAVISLKGQMGKEAREKLERCRQECLALDVRLFILYFKDVEAVQPTVFRELSLLQQDLRKKNAQICIVGLDFTKRQYLCERAIIRTGEIKKDMEEAIHFFSTLAA